MTGQPSEAFSRCAFEDAADLSLCLADVLVEQLRALDIDEKAARALLTRNLADLGCEEFATALAMSVFRSREGRTAGSPLGAGKSYVRNRS